MGNITEDGGTFRIHYTLVDGSEDSLVVSGDTMDQVRDKVAYEIARRSAMYLYSEEL